MNLAEELNQRFQKEGFPFEAEQNPECAVVKLPNGKTSDVLINNIHDIDQTFNIMRVIQEMKPDLLSTCMHFDDEGFVLESEGQTPYNIKAYAIDGGKVGINNLIKSDDKLVFEKDDTLYTVYVDSTRFRHITSDSVDATSHIESIMMDAREQFEILNNEMSHVHNEINSDGDVDRLNSNKRQSEFKRPKYQHAIEPDSLNQWVREQGLPLQYVESDVTPSGYGDPTVKIELFTTKGKKLNEYDTSQYGFDSQLVSDLNFMNQVYGENPKYIESAFSIVKNTVVTQLDVDQFAEITHEGNGNIQLSIHNRGEIYDRKYEENKQQSASFSVKTIATTETNIASINDDMTATKIQSDSVTSDLIDRYRQISDKLLGNELSVEDLAVNNNELQM